MSKPSRIYIALSTDHLHREFLWIYTLFKSRVLVRGVLFYHFLFRFLFFCDMRGCYTTGTCNCCLLCIYIRVWFYVYKKKKSVCMREFLLTAFARSCWCSLLKLLLFTLCHRSFYFQWGQGEYSIYFSCRIEKVSKSVIHRS